MITTEFINRDNLFVKLINVYFSLKYGSGISDVFTWNGDLKKIGSMIVGTSPELVMALDTICFLARPNNKPTTCSMSLNNVPVFITTYTHDYNGKTYIGNADPDWNKPS